MKGLIYEKVRRLSGFTPFERVINLTEPPDDITPFTVDLLEAFVRVYLANGTTRGSVITFIHGVTGPRGRLSHGRLPLARNQPDCTALRLAGLGGPVCSHRARN